MTTCRDLLSGVLLVFICIENFGVFAGGDSHEWSYKEVEKWCEVSKMCCGKKQSPIDLSSKAISNSGKPFKFVDYDKAPKTMKINNNGHSVSVDITSDDVKPKMSDGELEGTYVFAGFHFHWGDVQKGASEHTLDGKPFDMELHLVHYSDAYESIAKAIQSKDPKALAVLGVWIKFENEKNSAFARLVDNMKNISYKGQSKDFSPGISLASILPSDTSKFFRYQGSLTTPTCNEDVVWTMFQEPVTMAREQGKSFRLLFFNEENEEAEPMENNFRPVQPLNDRTVTLFKTSSSTVTRLMVTVTIRIENAK